jgi:hypothetical protein
MCGHLVGRWHRLERGQFVSGRVPRNRIARVHHPLRLKHLGIIECRCAHEHEPTRKGLSLVPVLLEIAAWGATHDPKTLAPKHFVKNFRADRDKVIANFESIVPRD